MFNIVSAFFLFKEIGVIMSYIPEGYLDKLLASSWKINLVIKGEPVTREQALNMNRCLVGEWSVGSEGLHQNRMSHTTQPIVKRFHKNSGLDDLRSRLLDALDGKHRPTSYDDYQVRELFSIIPQDLYAEGGFHFTVFEELNDRRWGLPTFIQFNGDVEYVGGLNMLSDIAYQGENVIEMTLVDLEDIAESWPFLTMNFVFTVENEEHNTPVLFGSLKNGRCDVKFMSPFKSENEWKDLIKTYEPVYADDDVYDYYSSDIKKVIDSHMSEWFPNEQ